MLVRAVLRGPDILCAEERTEATAAATGGRAFFDALDLTFAIRAAEEESRHAYVLGFYPSDEMLDGRTHRLTVKLKSPKPGGSAFEIYYRPAYLATKLPSGDELSDSVGLTAQLHSDPARPGLREMSLTVDLHDLHLELKDGHFAGAFDFSMLIPGLRAARSATAHVNLPEQQLEQALETGIVVSVGAIEVPQAGDIRVVVRDQATGATGSLRVPVARE